MSWKTVINLRAGSNEAAEPCRRRLLTRLLTVAAALLLAFSAAAADENDFPVDDLIYDRVIRKLANDRELKTTRLDVKVKDRVVTVKGVVATEKLQERVEKVVRKVDDVKKVVNRVTVRR